MTRDDFRGRRAKRGFGAKRQDLLTKLWEVDNDITHFIIAMAAGNKDITEKRQEAETRKAAIVAELLQITHEETV